MSWTQVQAEPAFGFMVIGLVIVFGPLLAERLRLPGLLGLLLGGALIGPNMLGVLPSFRGLESIGELGILYLIFLAGLQMDLETFKRYTRISAGFGLLTAFVPLVLGVIAARFLEFGWSASVLIGSFWASFTLIAYPTIKQFGLTRNRAVAATVGASAITDMISLIVLAIIVGLETSDARGSALILSIAVGLLLLAGYCFVVVPWVASWFFAGLGHERALRFMLVLVSLTSAAVVADLLGVEPLIGAFFVGVGLNRIVPNRSPLMALTDFFGNALFIPAFLISVGLLFDPAVMFVASTIRLAVFFTGALIAGKAVAAWLSGRIFGLSNAETGLMYSVSVAQAAATLAATIIGLEIGLYGGEVVNAVMVVIAVSLVITSVQSVRFARQIPPDVGERPRLGELVMVPIRGNEDQVPGLLDAARRIAVASGGDVQPIVVVPSQDQDDVEAGRAIVAETDAALRTVGLDADTQLRVDRSVATGISRAALEDQATMVLLGWPGPRDIRSWLLGATDDEISGALDIPAATIALVGDGYERVALLVRPDDVVPGRLDDIETALGVARALVGREHPLIIGPVPPERLVEAGVSLPDRIEYRDGSRNRVEWTSEVTDQGDLIVLPTRGFTLTHAAARIVESGRSVVVAAGHPAAELSSRGPSLGFRAQGSVGAG
jgi:Kef-type K+ transport system membrane component KefB